MSQGNELFTQQLQQQQQQLHNNSEDVDTDTESNDHSKSSRMHTVGSSSDSAFGNSITNSDSSSNNSNSNSSDGNDDRKRFKVDTNDSGVCSGYSREKRSVETAVRSLRCENEKTIDRFKETKEYFEKIFEFYEEDVEIRVMSLHAEIERHQSEMCSRLDVFQKRIKKWNGEKARRLEVDIKRIEKRLQRYVHDEQMLKKIFFTKNNAELSATTCSMVGRLRNPLDCKYDKIKASCSINVPFELLVCLTYFESLKRIIISDFNDRSFKVLDLDGNYLGSYNPDSVLERPGPICVSNLVKEIYIQDHVYEKIFVFDSNYNYLREFGDERFQTPFGMTIDEAESKVYLSAYLSNIVTIWNATNGDYIDDISVYSPTFMEIFRNKLIVMSATESEIFAIKHSQQESEDNRNSIYIYNKSTHEILNKFRISHCIHPKGLYVDDHLNLYITAYEFQTHRHAAEVDITYDNNIYDLQATTATNSHKHRFLYKFKENGDLMQKTNLGLSGIFSMVVVQYRLYAIRGYRAPPIYMIEFE